MSHSLKSSFHFSPCGLIHSLSLALLFLSLLLLPRWSPPLQRRPCRARHNNYSSRSAPLDNGYSDYHNEDATTHPLLQPECRTQTRVNACKIARTSKIARVEYKHIVPRRQAERKGNCTKGGEDSLGGMRIFASRLSATKNVEVEGALHIYLNIPSSSLHVSPLLAPPKSCRPLFALRKINCHPSYFRTLFSYIPLCNLFIV